MESKKEKKTLQRLSLHRERNFAEQSTYFYSDIALADVDMQVEVCFDKKLYMGRQKFGK